MRPAGYSTGALAPKDFRRALEMLQNSDADAVELSALRPDELKPLLDALTGLHLEHFRHVSIHAPGKFPETEELGIISSLKKATLLGIYVVVHPDALYNVKAWSSLGRWLCIENMDKRKPVGRTAAELSTFFDELPDAGLCFDVAHARQVDGSMTEASIILKRFANRLRQIHVSEVSTGSRHSRMSNAAARDFQDILNLIPADVPVISEAPVSAKEMDSELKASREVLTHP